jgi:hypothetical protein
MGQVARAPATPPEKGPVLADVLAAQQPGSGRSTTIRWPGVRAFGHSGSLSPPLLAARIAAS